MLWRRGEFDGTNAHPRNDALGRRGDGSRASEFSSEFSSELWRDPERDEPGANVLSSIQQSGRSHLRSCCLRSIERAYLDDPRIDERRDSIDERLRRVFFIDQRHRSGFLDRHWRRFDQRSFLDQSSGGSTIAGRDR